MYGADGIFYSLANEEEQVVSLRGKKDLGRDVFTGKCGQGGWEEQYDAYVVVASMLLDVSVAMAAFTHLFVSFRNQLQSPYIVDVILA